MSIRPTLQIGHPKLKAKNTPITDFQNPKLHQIIGDLTDTMHDAGLIGMAAPQIGENIKAFITEPRETETRPKDQADKLRVYINPTIIKESEKEVVIFEGCGSVLHGQLFGPVKRPQTITIEAHDLSGKKFWLTTNGILSRVIQHEYDHLDGIEFLEKISDYRQMMTIDHYLEQIKPDPDHINNCKITTKVVKYP